MENIDLKVQSQVRHEKWKILCESEDNIMEKTETGKMSYEEVVQMGKSQCDEIKRLQVQLKESADKLTQCETSNTDFASWNDELRNNMAEFERTFFTYAPANVKVKWLNEH